MNCWSLPKKKLRSVRLGRLRLNQLLSTSFFHDLLTYGASAKCPRGSSASAAFLQTKVDINKAGVRVDILVSNFGSDDPKCL
jgi:hypothetical protein